jgi:hypothetical protein
MIGDDPVLGPIRFCDKCNEWWPDDNEFWPADRIGCRACKAEGRVPVSNGIRYATQAERVAARRRTWRESYHRRAQTA